MSVLRKITTSELVPGMVFGYNPLFEYSQAIPVGTIYHSWLCIANDSNQIWFMAYGNSKSNRLKSFLASDPYAVTDIYYVYIEAT